MSRLIDADALQKEYMYEHDGKRLMLIDVAPTIEPQRKTGHWILHPEQKNIFGAKTIECSECGDKCLVQFVEKEKYWRNCGSYNVDESGDIPIEYFESGGK